MITRAATYVQRWNPPSALAFRYAGPVVIACCQPADVAAQAARRLGNLDR